MNEDSPDFATALKAIELFAEELTAELDARRDLPMGLAGLASLITQTAHDALADNCHTPDVP